MQRYQTFEEFCIGTYGKVPDVVGEGPELKEWCVYRGDVFLRELVCKLPIVDTVDTDEQLFVNYLVPDNDLGITAIRLVTLYEKEDKADWRNPTWLEVQAANTDAAVISAVSEMTGWALESDGEYEEQYNEGWDMLFAVPKPV